MKYVIAMLAVLVGGTAHAQDVWDKTPMDQQLANGIQHVQALSFNTAVMTGGAFPGFVECKSLPTWISNVMLQREIRALESQNALRDSATKKLQDLKDAKK